MITFQQAKYIVACNDGVFIHKIEELDGMTIHIFNYRLANYEDFRNNPGSEEMRGLTFLEREGTYTSWMHMHKFFNLGQGEDNTYENLRDKPLSFVSLKEDGSLIIPIVIDGKIYVKTRGSFHSEQACEAQKIVDNDDGLQSLIMTSYRDGKIPFFEYVSPFNRIVIKYKTPELRLLQVRSMDTGDYVDMSDISNREYFHSFGIHVAESFPVESLDYYMERCRSDEGYEGYVLTFDDGHMVKIKTEWYKHLHHLLTENLTRECDIIHWVLDDELDDVLAQLDNDDPQREFCLDIARHTRHNVNRLTAQIKKDFQEYNGNRKEFALSNKHKEHFNVLMKLVGKNERGELVDDDQFFQEAKTHIKAKTMRLEESRHWLATTGFNQEG